MSCVHKLKPLLFIIFTLTFAACKQKNPTKTLVTEDLKYSAYYWHFNEHADSFEFYLVHYIDIDRNGKFIVMRHDTPRVKPKYFIGFISDTIRKFIDTTFSNDNFKTDYTWKVENSFVYDGFTYCFDYQIQKKRRKEIQFIPHNSPDQIKELSSLLDTLIYTSASKPTDTLNLNNYTNQLKQLYLSVSQPPPKIQKTIIEFKPPKISK